MLDLRVKRDLNQDASLVNEAESRPNYDLFWERKSFNFKTYKNSIFKSASKKATKKEKKWLRL